MASQSKMQSATSSSSLSRLSPHAQPFIFSNWQQSLGLSTTSMVNDSFSGLETAWYSSEGFGLSEYEGIVVGSSSMDDQSLLKTENHAVEEGSQLFGEGIGSLSRHLADVSATQTKAIAATEQLGSEHCLLPSLSYTTGLMRSAPPVVVVDNIDYTSNAVDGKRYLSKHKCFEGSKSMDCPSLETYQVQALDIRKSGDPLITSKEVENDDGEKETNQSYVWINDMQFACPNHPNQLKVKLKSTEGGCSVVDSFVVVDNEEDSDVDSPCWKGKTAEKSKSAFVESGTLDPELTKYKPKSGSALNPKAPQFLPRSVETRLSAPLLGELGGGYVSMSFEKIPPDSPPLFTNQMSWELSDAFNSTGTGYFSMLYESEENIIHDSITEADIDGDSFSFPMAMMHGDGDCSVLGETLLQQLAKSRSTPPGPGVVDADILVDTIHALSELLVENCSSSLFSKEQLQLEKLKYTIKNLSLLSVKDVDGQNPSSIHGSDVECCIPSYLTKSLHTSKLLGTEFQAARTKVVISPPEISHLRNYDEPRKVVGSSMISQDLKSFSSDIGNEIAQAAAMKSTSASGHEMEEHQMSPQALIYKNLWLQATQELHFIKKKAWRNTETCTT